MESENDKVRLKAKSDALKLLSFRPRSVEELRDRLKKKGYAGAAIDEVVGSLKSQGLLDDEKFAKLFSQSRIYTRPTGKKVLAQELKKKGLSEQIVSETLANLKDFDESVSALELAEKRFSRVTGLSAEKKKSRIYGFLKRRGFRDDVVYEVIKKLIKTNDYGSAT